MISRVTAPKKVQSIRYPISISYAKGHKGNPCFVVTHSFTQDPIGTFFAIGGLDEDDMACFARAGFKAHDEFMFLELSQVCREMFPRAIDWIEESIETACLYWYPEIALNLGWEETFENVKEGI